MKKSLKVLISTICAFVLIVLLVLGIFAVKDCYVKADKYENDRIIAHISSEYKEKFLSKGFEIEDFNLNNIERIEYGYWSEGDNCGKITVYLKKSGWWQAGSAIRKLEKLPFVKDAVYFKYDGFLFPTF